jgi:hypothetical protein
MKILGMAKGHQSTPPLQSLASHDEVTFDALDKRMYSDNDDGEEEDDSVTLNGYSQTPRTPSQRKFHVVTPPSAQTDPPANARKKKQQIMSKEEEEENVSSSDASININIPKEQADLAAQQQRTKRRYQRLVLLSDLFFVIGCALYMTMAIDDMKWAKEAQSIPLAVLQSQDASVWAEYRSTGTIIPTQAPIGGLTAIMENETALSQLDTKTTNGNGRQRHLRGQRRQLTNYDEYSWSELLPNVQAAAEELGFDQDRWDNGIPVYTEELEWNELSVTQRNSAETLGYSEAVWDADRQEEDGDNDTDVVGSTTIAPTNIPTTVAVKWDQYAWDDLPSMVQAAFRVLGWNRGLWDGGESAESEKMRWQDLTIQQQEAAEFLGYTEAQWEDLEEDATVAPTNGQTQNNGTDVGGIEVPSVASEKEQGESISDESVEPIAQEEAPDQEWYDYWWSELPPEVQEAYATLGYSQHSWDNGKPVETSEMPWKDLSLEQQEAALTLGFYQAAWDNVADHQASTIATNTYVSTDDDYVFFVPSRQAYVSRYMILYFAAALCFVVTGTIDYLRDRKLFHLCMILGGLSGLVSAMLIERDRTASMVMNLISVHLFLLDGLIVVKKRIQSLRQKPLKECLDEDEISVPDTTLLSGLWWIPTLHITADFFFVIGALMDVILSYLYFDRSSDWNLAIARLFGFSTLLWVACSILHLHITLVLCNGWFPCCLGKDRHRQAITSRERELRKMAFVGPIPDLTDRESTSQ